MNNASQNIREWRENPCKFVNDVFKVEPDKWQEEALTQFADPNCPRIALKACAGPGKAQPTDLVIETPDGLRVWGSLKPGDRVFAEDGSPTRIKAVYPQGVLPMFRVYFDDGTSTVVCGDHLWKARGRTERRHFKSRARKNWNGYSVLSTLEIIERNKSGDGNRRQFEIPTQGAAYYPPADLLVDPYLLGVWLGDGCRNSGRAAWREAEIDNEIVSRGYEINRTDLGRSVTVYGLSAKLKALGLLGLGSPSRFVPDAYKRASIEQRTALLGGLLDTDGTIGDDGSMSFDVTSRQLLLDVAWLVRSLGGMARERKTKKASYRDKTTGVLIECRDCYRLTVTLPFNPFRVIKKATRWRKPQQRYLTRYIDAIVPAQPADAMCIEVEHESACYLTNDFIVTHNTAALAWMGWNFMLCYARPGEHPKGVAISKTWDNLRDNLWSELAKWQNRSEMLKRAFTWQKERIFANDHPQTWFLSARAYNKNANEEEQGRVLSGLHSKFIFYLIDESGDTVPAVLRSAEQGLSNCEVGKIVQAGNPTSQLGMLYHACTTARAQWYIITITGDPDDKNRSQRIDLAWAKEQVRLYGRDNPWVQAFILGEFPPGGINQLISLEECEKAVKRHYRPEDYNNMAKILGVDVARQGMDASVIFGRQGLTLSKPHVMRNVNSIDGAAKVATVWKAWDADACFVDDTGGFGAGWIDQLRVMQHQPIGIHFSGKPVIAQHYVNRRAEMYWNAAQWIRDGGMIPDCPELIADLTITTYTHRGDLIQIESKEQIKERLKRSPDWGDAFVLTFAQPVMPKHKDAMFHTLAQQSNNALDYNPYAPERFG